MDYTLTISQPILVSGQEFRVRIRAYPAGSFGGTTVFTTQDLTFTGLSAGQYEVEVIFFDGLEECPADYVIFTAVDDPACPTFSAIFMANSTNYWIRVSWSGVVGYPTCGYQIYVTQGATVRTLSYPTALPAPNFVDIPVPNGNPVDVFITSNNCYQEKICFDTTVTYSEPCIGLTIIDVSIAQDVNGSLNWVITIFLTQSTPATLTTGISYVQTNPALTNPPASGAYSTSLSPTATSYSFSVYVPAYTGARPTFSGTMTDACGNARSWSI